jgi:hypothetical protein
LVILSNVIGSLKFSQPDNPDRQAAIHFKCAIGKMVFLILSDKDCQGMMGTAVDFTLRLQKPKGFRVSQLPPVKRVAWISPKVVEI